MSDNKTYVIFNDSPNLKAKGVIQMKKGFKILNVPNHWKSDELDSSSQCKAQNLFLSADIFKNFMLPTEKSKLRPWQLGLSDKSFILLFGCFT